MSVASLTPSRIDTMVERSTSTSWLPAGRGYGPVELPCANADVVAAAHNAPNQQIWIFIVGLVSGMRTTTILQASYGFDNDSSSRIDTTTTSPRCASRSKRAASPPALNHGRSLI